MCDCRWVESDTALKFAAAKEEAAKREGATADEAEGENLDELEMGLTSAGAAGVVNAAPPVPLAKAVSEALRVAGLLAVSTHTFSILRFGFNFRDVFLREIGLWLLRCRRRTCTSFRVRRRLWLAIRKAKNYGSTRARRRKTQDR